MSTSNYSYQIAVLCTVFHLKHEEWVCLWLLLLAAQEQLEAFYSVGEATTNLGMLI